MLLIRRFEETILNEFKRGIFPGTTHTYIGEEANAVGVLSQVLASDIVVSNHRGHGHFLAFGGDPMRLFAELMGKSCGLCGGRGGSQHLHWQNFYSSGVLGGTLPLAVGMALAEKRKRSGAIVIVFSGDGALGEGVAYEAFNLASLWSAPVLFVIENNHIAQTTPTKLALAGSIDLRLAAFGIPCTELDTSDVLEIIPAAKDLIGKVRTTQSPQALILNTERFAPHSKGDDTRPEEVISRLYQERDPLTIHGARLAEEDCQATQVEVDATISDAFTQAASQD